MTRKGTKIFILVVASIFVIMGIVAIIHAILIEHLLILFLPGSGLIILGGVLFLFGKA